MFITRLSFLLLLVCSAAGSLAQSPEFELDVENYTIRIDVYDVRNNLLLESGTGFLVGEDEEHAWFVTAEHVLEEAREEPAERIKVQARFAHSRYPFELEMLPRLTDDGAPIDIAALKAVRRTARRMGAPPENPLLVAPPEATGERMNVALFGHDVALEELRWLRPGRATSEPDGTIRFSVGGLQPGFSGSMLISRTGVAGVVTQKGPSRRDNRAIPIGTVTRVLSQANIPVDLGPPDVSAALDFAYRNELLIGVFGVHSRSDAENVYCWYALHLASKNDRGGYRAKFSTPFQSADATIKPTPSGFSVEMSTPVLWNALPHGRSQVNPGAQSFSTVTPTVEGFIQLRCDADTTPDSNLLLTAYLPQQRHEFLAARMIHGSPETYLHFPGRDLLVGHPSRGRLYKSREIKNFLLLNANHFKSLILNIPPDVHCDGVVELVGAARIPDQFRGYFGSEHFSAGRQIAVRAPGTSPLVLNYEQPDFRLAWRPDEAVTTMHVDMPPNHGEFHLLLENALLKYQGCE